jgi:hypothetical protein
MSHSKGGGTGGTLSIGSVRSPAGLSGFSEISEPAKNTKNRIDIDLTGFFCWEFSGTPSIPGTPYLFPLVKFLENASGY